MADRGIANQWCSACRLRGDLDPRHQVGVGVGMMGIVESLTLGYSNPVAGLPRTMIAKYSATNEANRNVGEMFDIYRREVLFFRDIAPTAGVAGPKVFFSDIEGSANQIILMEDLSAYELGDQVQGCTYAEAKPCMELMGKLHASFWNKTDKPELDFIPVHFPSNHADAMAGGAAAGWDPMVNVFGEHIPPHIRAMKEQYLANIPKLQEWIGSAPITVVHGDFRMDNLFFGREPGQDPVRIVDWQGTLRSKGVQDVAYLLSHSVLLEDRRAHERELVGLWHQSLVNHGVTGYSADQAWEDYRKAVLYLWTYVVVIAGTLDATNERGVAWMSQMVARAVAAIDDLDLLPMLD